jgi:uncharacterized phage infection (PIP) family protein YhgE
MDPASIIGIVSAATSLVFTCGKIVRSLNDLKEKYTDANTTLRNISLECGTLQASVMQIKTWIESLPSQSWAQRDIDERMQPLNQAIVGFDASLEPLYEEDVKAVLGRTT